MSAQESPAPLPKPTLPPFWKWFMRITFAVTMVLFLAPAVYVVKYYAVDRPQEEAISAKAKTAPLAQLIDDLPSAAFLPALEARARDTHAEERTEAIQRIGTIVRQPGIGYKRPIECLSAKATLADLAAKDPDPTVRASASQELGQIAENGAVLRR